MKTISRKVEYGVLVMKNDKAWGVNYSDGRSTSYGWIDPANAELSDSEYCKHPEDLTYQESPYVGELKAGKLVFVERITQVNIINEVSQ